jgi:DNA-binding transcriptional LysR family regulator
VEDGARGLPGTHRGKGGGVRFDGLDLNLLVALDALLKERNITRASEQVHLTQSAMSNALGRLREYFNDELLVQVGRKLELTPRAEGLQEAVHDVLLRIKTSIATQPTFVPEQSDRTFKLLISEYTSSLLMPTMLELVWQQSKTVGFEFMAQTTDPFGLLSRGEADLLLIPDNYLATDHPSEVLFEESYVCVIWKDHSTIGDTLSFEEYLAASHVAVQYGHEHLPAFEGWFLQRFGVVRKIQVVTPNLLAPPELVVGTDRIATIHRRVAQRASATLPIRILPSPIEIPSLKLAMQWHQYRSSDPGLLWLRELLRRAAATI